MKKYEKCVAHVEMDLEDILLARADEKLNDNEKWKREKKIYKSCTE